MRRAMPLGWLVFVELPIAGAHAPLYAGLAAVSLVLLAALAVAGLAGMFLAKRRRSDSGLAAARRVLAAVIWPSTSPSRPVTNWKRSPISSTTWPRLQESHAGLEDKAELRTRNWRAALEQNARLFQEIEEKGKQLEAANLRMRAELDFVGQMQEGAAHAGRTAAIDGLDIAASWNRRTKSAATTTMSCTPMASSPSALAMSPAMA